MICLSFQNIAAAFEKFGVDAGREPLIEDREKIQFCSQWHFVLFGQEQVHEPASLCTPKQCNWGLQNWLLDCKSDQLKYYRLGGIPSGKNGQWLVLCLA